MNEICSSKGRCQLFFVENRLEVMRIFGGIVATSLFSVDVPSSSESVWFGAEASGPKANNKVKTGEEY